MRLTDCFSELVAYVSYFLKTVEHRQPPFDQVKQDILRLLTQSEDCVKQGAFSPEDYDQARFAVCAWIDEAILSSNWKERQHWQRQQLQRMYYNTTDAGELFFERLNNLGLHQRDVREVYYLCLAMGFTGRYCQEGDDYLLDQLRASNLKLLMGSSVEVPTLDRSELFPGAYPSEAAASRVKIKAKRFSLVTILAGAGPVVLFGVLFWVFHFILNSVGESFLTTVP
ncbi:MAG: type IVB secretion system protein IcmH/DotU [Deltaproteobacteria bacterium]|nr:type IVB secretion system protein IcmH/DotU [Deltaproteobacteria bacterium]MBW1928453.1 type IVB secretion system protein IcmH/DotU [Deltaproteobacteria bacterium]MBW2024212.1 type IVB secretion system protein IcmH/DotU [Deltaproteobacteria bacterium]MBW2125734.1 type IVB secretion system protein IcmH/DotU [Deltaproteobacteria bacterium]